MRGPINFRCVTPCQGLQILIVCHVAVTLSCAESRKETQALKTPLRRCQRPYIITATIQGLKYIQMLELVLVIRIWFDFGLFVLLLFSTETSATGNCRQLFCVLQAGATPVCRYPVPLPKHLSAVIGSCIWRHAPQRISNFEFRRRLRLKCQKSEALAQIEVKCGPFFPRCSLGNISRHLHPDSVCECVSRQKLRILFIIFQHATVTHVLEEAGLLLSESCPSPEISLCAADRLCRSLPWPSGGGHVLKGFKEQPDMPLNSAFTPWW